MTRLRLGLIGCGGMGSRHAEGFDQLEDRVRVTAAVDIELERAEAVADQFDGCRATTDYEAVLDDVDGVLIALPHRLHHPAARFFLDAGKHVLLEKPMATTEEHCLDLIEASERSNRVLMTAYVMRFNPLVVRMKELLDRAGLRRCVSGFDLDRAVHAVARLSGAYDGRFTGRRPAFQSRLSLHRHPALVSRTPGPRQPPWHQHGHALDGAGREPATSPSSSKAARSATTSAPGAPAARSSATRSRPTAPRACWKSTSPDGQLLAHTNLRGEQRVASRTEVLLDASAGIQPGLNDAVRVELGRVARVAELSHFLDCIEAGHRPLTDGPGSLQGLRLIWRLYEAEEQGVVADLKGLGLDEYRA